MAKLPVPKKPANILCICFSAFVIIMMNGITKKLLKDMKKNTDRLKKGKKLMKSVEKYGTGTGKGIPTSIIRDFCIGILKKDVIWTIFFRKTCRVRWCRPKNPVMTN